MTTVVVETRDSRVYRFEVADLRAARGLLGRPFIIVQTERGFVAISVRAVHVMEAVDEGGITEGKTKGAGIEGASGV